MIGIGAVGWYQWRRCVLLWHVCAGAGWPGKAPVMHTIHDMSHAWMVIEDGDGACISMVISPRMWV